MKTEPLKSTGAKDLVYTNKLPIHKGKKNFKVIEKRLTQTYHSKNFEYQTLSMKLIDPNFTELCFTFRSLDLGKTNRKIYSINDQTCSSFQLNTQPKHQTLNGLHYK